MSVYPEFDFKLKVKNIFLFELLFFNNYNILIFRLLQQRPIQYTRLIIPKNKKQKKYFFENNFTFPFSIDIQSFTASPSRAYAFKSIFDVCKEPHRKKNIQKVWRMKKRCYT